MSGLTGGGPTTEPAAPLTGWVAGRLVAGVLLLGTPKAGRVIESESEVSESPGGRMTSAFTSGPRAFARARRSAEDGVWSGIGGLGAAGAGRLAVRFGVVVVRGGTGAGRVAVRGGGMDDTGRLRGEVL